MIRKTLIVVLMSGAIATALLWVATWIVPFWHVWKSGQASVRVYVAHGGVEAWYQDIRQGTTFNHMRVRAWPGFYWEVRHDVRSHGVWRFPGKRLRPVIAPGQPIPPGAVYEKPSFRLEHHVYVSLWGALTAFAIVPSAVFAAPRLRRRRRRLRGLCVKCAYDLTGNVSGVCPECGTKVERS